MPIASVKTSRLRLSSFCRRTVSKRLINVGDSVIYRVAG
jgi:hypothetical protein